MWCERGRVCSIVFPPEGVELARADSQAPIKCLEKFKRLPEIHTKFTRAQPRFCAVGVIRETMVKRTALLMNMSCEDSRSNCVRSFEQSAVELS